MTQKEILDMLNFGFTLTLGRVTISNINSAIYPRIQVYSDDFRCPFSAVYHKHEAEIAVDKFIGILNQIKGRNGKKPKG
jgi:hypothetical protein